VILEYNPSEPAGSAPASTRGLGDGSTEVVAKYTVQSPITLNMSLNPPMLRLPLSRLGSRERSRPPLRSNVSSAAQLKLLHLHEQSRRGAPNSKDGKKHIEASAGLPTKGKPRLLLMGQRRSVDSVTIAINCLTD
jgi:hypothetical protein